MSNKMALDALTAALAAMEYMANVLNNIDAVDEEEDAKHDAAFEAVRAAIAELEQPKKPRIVAASMNSYPEADQRFFNFWYGHMFEDLMQPPLVGIDHATARYIWNAAAIAALQAEPQGWMPIETAPKNKVLLLGYFNAAGRWRTVRGEWFSQEEIDEQWEEPENGEPGWYETCVNADDPPNCWPIEPTHWMPLPTPPKD